MEFVFAQYDLSITTHEHLSFFFFEYEHLSLMELQITTTISHY